MCECPEIGCILLLQYKPCKPVLTSVSYILAPYIKIESFMLFRVFFVLLTILLSFRYAHVRYPSRRSWQDMRCWKTRQLLAHLTYQTSVPGLYIFEPILLEGCYFWVAGCVAATISDTKLVPLESWIQSLSRLPHRLLPHNCMVVTCCPKFQPTNRCV
jgi:hypothetical protein